MACSKTLNLKLFRFRFYTLILPFTLLKIRNPKECLRCVSYIHQYLPDLKLILWHLEIFTYKSLYNKIVFIYKSIQLK